MDISDRIFSAQKQRRLIIQIMFSSIEITISGYVYKVGVALRQKVLYLSI